VVPVYRLDAAASGIVLFALQPADLERWTRALDGATDGSDGSGGRRVYLAAVRGVTAATGVIRRALDPGKKKGRSHEPETRFERLAVCAGHSLVRLTVATADEGRHQVRRHLAALGHPLLGDDRYGHPATNRHFSEKYGLDRVFLHCVQLELATPDGSPWRIDSPLAPDLALVLERMGGAARL
jgi:23S rRNA (uracil1939-C5)-methyltransferase